MNTQHSTDTILAHEGRSHSQLGVPVNPPVYRQSTLLFESIEALKVASGTPNAYGRGGSPTTRSLERTLARLEGRTAPCSRRADSAQSRRRCSPCSIPAIIC